LDCQYRTLSIYWGMGKWGDGEMGKWGDGEMGEFN